MRLIDKLFASNRFAISTKFLTILANAVANEQELLHTISYIQTNTTHPEFSAVLLDIAAYISYGNSFSAATYRHSIYFDRILTSQLTIGENSGNLLASLTTIVTQRTKKLAYQQKLKKSLAYPIFLLVIASTILTSFIMLVIPTIYDAISEISSSKSSELISIINTANHLQNWLPIYAKAAAVLILCYALAPRQHAKHKYGVINNYHSHKIIYHMPIAYSFYRLRFISLFTHNLAILLKANTDIQHTFNILIALENNLYLAEKLMQAQALIIKGLNLSSSLQATALFPRDFIADLQAAEVANTVANTLESMAKKYSNDLEDNIVTCCKLIEPAIIITTAFIIGSILITIYIPLLSVAEVI